MKFLSETTIINSWKNIIKIGVNNRAPLNKFFGVLELLQLISLEKNENINSNVQYRISTSSLSNSLQDKYFFDEKNLKTFTSQETLSIIFPKNWIGNIFQAFLKSNQLPLEDVAVICLHNETFDDNFTQENLVNLFIDKFNLNEAVDTFFIKKTNDIQFELRILNRQNIFTNLKKYFDLSDNTKYTIGFDKSLIAANPGELTRGPFIQPLYSGQENLKCLLLANFNILDYYEINPLLNQKQIFSSNSNTEKSMSHHVIYYGSPGTGKSHRIKEIVKGKEEFTERVTFHPEYDYTSFVGGYKPTSKDGDIKYEFAPQVFTNIYVKAWNDLNNNEHFLVIEEINRGNCAEIFGDIFQLLDRNPEYLITPSDELKNYLEKNLTEKGVEGIAGGKMKLPENLTILASMNTSDQSLFPMDSAFKRRWDWEYIPICYDPIDDFKKKNESFDFEIDIQDGNKYRWLKFIEAVNLNHIKNNASLGMDKCLGNYFIKPDNANTISLKPFINKVIFYLWNDVFKDEENKVFEENTSYEDFFPIQTKGKEKIKELFERIDLKKIPNPKIYQEENVLDMAAEPEIQSES